MSGARALGEDLPETSLGTLPSLPSPAAEPRPLRLAVPLVLAAGWGALLTFSLMFLLEDGRGSVAASDRVALADQSDGERRTDVLPPRPEAIRIVPAVQTVAAVESAITVAPPASDPPSAAVPASPPVDRVSYVGTWGPTPQACGSASRRRGYLPAMITEDGAKAGRTLCRFRNGRRDGIAWTMAADCSERGRNWTSQVRLLVDGDRLTWTSAKGASTYVRCGRRDG